MAGTAEKATAANTIIFVYIKVPRHFDYWRRLQQTGKSAGTDALCCGSVLRFALYC
jgi:hypothetical protein